MSSIKLIIKNHKYLIIALFWGVTYILEDEVVSGSANVVSMKPLSKT